MVGANSLGREHGLKGIVSWSDVPGTSGTCKGYPERARLKMYVLCGSGSGCSLIKFIGNMLHRHECKRKQPCYYPER